MALSRAHTSAKAADPAKLLHYKQTPPVKHTQCRGVKSLASTEL